MKPSTSRSKEIFSGFLFILVLWALFLAYYYVLKTSAPLSPSLLPMTKFSSLGHHNRLANEKSPYLLQHSNNPVEWYPWGEEAFAKARKENKPIFLSIGYSTCHWCHVMAHESFENEAIAKLMNENFINIKVDREERPDVDQIYMNFIQTTTGRGGWPMSVWLTPDLKPFAGGTYFPPTDQWGHPGFATVLKRIHAAWKKEQEKVLAQSESILKSLQENIEGDRQSPPSLLPDKKTLHQSYQQLAATFDAQNGGFGNAPKFPRPTILYFLLRTYARQPNIQEGKHALEMALITLQKMAAGGIHDHLGGGFHRYSVDEFWHVPHFEKMLYDQAQLALAYLEAYQITQDEAYAKVARGILDYVLRDMTSPEGGFYSAEDADSFLESDSSQKSEGAFYLWKQDDIETILGKKQAETFNFVFDIKPEGNAPFQSDPHHEFIGRNILIQKQGIYEAAQKLGISVPSLNKKLERANEKLFEARKKRPRPHLDDKIITAWNGLMISALARGSQILQTPHYLIAAEKAASFLHHSLVDSTSGELIRSYRQGPSTTRGFADDYAFLIQGLLDLYEASLDSQWLEQAEKWQEKQDALFYDFKKGGYFQTTDGAQNILLRLKENFDGAEPSPTSISTLNLLRLSAMLNRKDWKNKAEKNIASLAQQLNELPTSLPQMLVALDFSLQPPQQIILAASSTNPQLDDFLNAISKKFLPHRILLLADGSKGQKYLAEKNSFFSTFLLQNKEEVTAYLCENFTCKLPTQDLTTFEKQLKGASPPSPPKQNF